ncbi:MAG: isochorismatase family protein [Solirubrobacterales bacterium]|nr:isochorismatase family protein [Solirubrobacterales bacterium]
MRSRARAGRSASTPSGRDERSPRATAGAAPCKSRGRRAGKPARGRGIFPMTTGFARHTVAMIATHGRDPLHTLERKLDPSHCALVVIDMLNDFCADGGAMAEEGLDVSPAQRMAGRLPAVIDSARDAGALVVFVRNVYSTDDDTYLSDVWLEQAGRRREGSYVERPVCAPDSWGSDFYSDVRPLAGEPIVTKHRFDAFLNTDLDLILRSNGIRSVVIAGVATNVCVETSVRHAFVSDYYVVVPSDGAAAYSSEEQAASLATIDRYFGQVSSCDEIAAIWDAGRGSVSEAIRQGGHVEQHTR